MKTHKEATKKPKEGYKYADHDQVFAHTCGILAKKHCLRPQAVYKWAVKHNVPLAEIMPTMVANETIIEANEALLYDVLNDQYFAVPRLPSIRCPKSNNIAKEIADSVLRAIYVRSDEFKGEEPYSQQMVLELVISKLEKAV